MCADEYEDFNNDGFEDKEDNMQEDERSMFNSSHSRGC